MLLKIVEDASLEELTMVKRKGWLVGGCMTDLAKLSFLLMQLLDVDSSENVPQFMRAKIINLLLL